MEVQTCLSCFTYTDAYDLVLEETGYTKGDSMETQVHAPSLERIVRRIRDTVPREPNQTLDAYFKATWQQALREYEEVKPKLPNVERARERTERLLAIAGKPEQEKETEE